MGMISVGARKAEDNTHLFTPQKQLVYDIVYIQKVNRNKETPPPEILNDSSIRLELER